MLLPLSAETKIGHSEILGNARIGIPNKRISFENPNLGKQSGSSFTTSIVELTQEECFEYKKFDVEKIKVLENIKNFEEVEKIIYDIENNIVEDEDKKQLELFH